MSEQKVPTPDFSPGHPKNPIPGIRDSRLIKVFTSVLIGLLIAYGVLNLTLYREVHQTLRQITEMSGLWELTQLQRQLLLVQLAMKNDPPSGGSEAQEQLNTEWELMWSRLILFNQGGPKRIIESLPGAKPIFEEIDRSIQSLDKSHSSFFNLPPDERKAMVGQIGTAARSVQHLHATADNSMKVEKERFRQMLIWLEIMSSGVAGAILVCMGALIFLVWRTLINQVRTAQFLSQANRKSKEVAENATHLKDKFVTLVAHDLRSPLGSMSAMSDIALKAIQEPLNKEALTQSVVGIQRLTRLLLDMIDDLLQLSRLQNGQLVPMLRLVHGIEVSSILFELRSVADRKNIRMENQIPDDLVLSTDLNLLRQVLINLLSNAIKFCNAGDTITLYVHSTAPLTLAVRDTGIGIPADMMPDLLNENVKSSRTGTFGERGTGLGLLLCRDIMTVLGGALRVESTEGQGSTFYMDMAPHK